MTSQYFNSRLYMRGNRPRRGESGQRKHFNSRLYMRGNKPPLQLRQQTEVYFNSRLYMRGNAYFLHGSLMWEYFNSRLYMRGNTNQVITQEGKMEFQFTPLHERQLQKYTIFSIKSTQFSTKPCFFIVTSRKAVFFSIPVQYFL